MQRRVTRARTALLFDRANALAVRVLASADIQSLLLPRLDFLSFVALRRTSKEVCDATQHVCEDLIQILERAAALYISPRFADGLALIAEYKLPICWLIQTPALAVVAPQRHEELIATSYHLLQAHLSRLQKLSVSLSLRRASSTPRDGVAEGSRFMLMHLGVRLGMFTESPQTLKLLLEAAEAAVVGLTRHHAHRKHQPPATAAAHYTLAGFYTYHHKRDELPDALGQAQRHLDAALRIQRRQLGPRHVSTLCSQLVKSQVMLLQANTRGCDALLTKQLQFCEATLSSAHPLAAKMLAVLARLRNKQGALAQCVAPPRPHARPTARHASLRPRHRASQLRDATSLISSSPFAALSPTDRPRPDLLPSPRPPSPPPPLRCERLQQRVLTMRRVALGLHHEDTHRSAMDVYQRRRSYVQREVEDTQGCAGVAARACEPHEHASRTSMRATRACDRSDLRIVCGCSPLPATWTWRQRWRR